MQSNPFTIIYAGVTGYNGKVGSLITLYVSELREEYQVGTSEWYLMRRSYSGLAELATNNNTW
jgi:hypothetical protein